MNRLYASLIVMIIASATLGCSMCCGPYDFDYPTYGGIHPRANRTHGRVGSVFSDPNAMVGGITADSNLVPQPEIRSEVPDQEEDQQKTDDMDKFRKELDALESISPKEGGVDELPNPEDRVKDPTASMWNNEPLRSEWR